MKLIITEEEWFPVYDLGEPDHKPWGYECELDDTLIKRHKKAVKEFRAVQDLLEQALKDQHGEYR
jgi:hypothetical protein